MTKRDLDQPLIGTRWVMRGHGTATVLEIKDDGTVIVDCPGAGGIVPTTPEWLDPVMTKDEAELLTRVGERHTTIVADTPDEFSTMTYYALMVPGSRLAYLREIPTIKETHDGTARGYEMRAVIETDSASVTVLLPDADNVRRSYCPRR